MTRDYKHTTRSRKKPQFWFGWPWLGAGVVLGFGLIGYQYSKQAQDQPVPLPSQVSTPTAPPASAPVSPESAPPVAAMPPAGEPAKLKYDFYEVLPNEPIVLPAPTAPTAKTSAPTAPSLPPVTSIAKPEALATIPTDITKKTKPELKEVKEVKEVKKPEVKPPVIPPKTVVKPAAKLAKPYLQVGAFQKQEQAQQHKAKLSALGFNASLKTIQKDQTTWYRVYVGPYGDEAGLTAAERKLQQNKITHLRSP